MPRRRRPALAPAVDRLEPRALLSTLRATTAAEVRASPALVHEAAAGRVVRNIPYNGRGVQLDLYVPGGPAPAGGRPIVLALEGGGWRHVDRRAYGQTVASALGRYGYIVASADYAFADRGPSWPRNLEDCRDAVRWLRQNAAKFGGDPDRIVALGESAGGNLASLLGTYPDGPVARDGLPADPTRHDPGPTSARVQAVVDFYGEADLARHFAESRTGRGFVRGFLGGTPATVPGRYVAASPVSHVTPDDPPFLILQGANDTGVHPDQSQELASALDAAGVSNRLVVIPGAGHGFKFVAARRNLVPDVVAFLRATVGP